MIKTIRHDDLVEEGCDAIAAEAYRSTDAGCGLMLDALPRKEEDDESLDEWGDDDLSDFDEDDDDDDDDDAEDDDFEDDDLEEDDLDDDDE